MFKARSPKAAFDYSRWYILKDQMCKLLLNGCWEVIIVKWDTIWVWNSFRIFFWTGLGFFFGFLGWYHLPSVCNGLELEFVILHGICHIWACSPSILHGIYYMWACSPSILYGICHILACSPSILHGISYMWACSPSIQFATFWHVHLPFCMGCSTCEHVHPNIYRCGSLGLDKKRVGRIEGGR